MEVAYAEAVGGVELHTEVGPARTGAPPAGDPRLNGRLTAAGAWAEALRPPEPRMGTGGCAGGLLLAAAAATLLLGVGVGVLGLVFWPALVLAVVLVAAAACLLFLGVRLLGKADPLHDAAVAAWRRRWLCRACGHRWEGPEPAADAFRVPKR